MSRRSLSPCSHVGFRFSFISRKNIDTYYVLLHIRTEQAAYPNVCKKGPRSPQVSDAVLDACLKVDPYSKVHRALDDETET